MLKKTMLALTKPSLSQKSTIRATYLLWGLLGGLLTGLPLVDGRNDNIEHYVLIHSLMKLGDFSW
jgi:hypothetical protein